MNDCLPCDAETLAETAADWIVRLSADDPEERRQAEAGFTAWKNADPRHAAAAASLEHLIGQLDGIRRNGNQTPARRTLVTVGPPPPRPRKLPARRLGATLLLAVGLLLPAWSLIQQMPPSALLADIRTGRGEWMTHTLDDGSHVSLSGTSAVTLDFSANRRTVKLLHGDILVDVAPDAARPFVVETEHGSIRALGTRFLVRHRDNATELNMLESRVEVRASNAAEASTPPRIVAAGQTLRFGPGQPLQPQDDDPALLEEAWKHRQLVVHNQPLTTVLDELARHHPGIIRYDRSAIAGKHVSAVLPLTDTERALQLLANNFPDLRIRTLTPYWVSVDAQPGQ